MESPSLDSSGGAALAARLYRGGGAVRGAVLIGGAKGVNQDYHATFAQWLATQGLAVISFDCRGVGDSRAATHTRSLRGFEADLFSSARDCDCDCAIDADRERAPGSPLCLIGHFGIFCDRFQSSLWARSVALLQGFTSPKETTA